MNLERMRLRFARRWRESRSLSDLVVAESTYQALMFEMIDKWPHLLHASLSFPLAVNTEVITMATKKSRDKITWASEEERARVVEVLTRHHGSIGGGLRAALDLLLKKYKQPPLEELKWGGLRERDYEVHVRGKSKPSKIIRATGVEAAALQFVVDIHGEIADPIECVVTNQKGHAQASITVMPHDAKSLIDRMSKMRG
jgi:hypothetical protein